MNDENLDKKVEETKDTVEETVSETISNDPPIKVAEPAPEVEVAKEEVKEEPKEEIKEEPKEEAPVSEAGEKVFESPSEPTPEPTSEPAVATPETGEAPKEKKSGGKGKLIVPALAIIIILAAAIGYMLLSKNPKTVFHKFFTTVQSEVKNNKYLNSENKIKGQTEFTITSDLEGFDSIFTDKKQIVTYGFDASKHALELGIASENADNTGLVAFVKDGHAYLKLNKANRTTLLDNSQSFGQYAQALVKAVNSNTISNQDAAYLIDKVISLVDTSMMDGKYSKGKETVTIGNNKVHLNKYTYKIDKDVLVSQGNKVIKGLKEDSKSKEIINNLLKSQEMTIDEIPEIKAEDIGEMKDVKFSIFTKGLQATFAGVKLEIDKNAIVYGVNNGEYVLNSNGENGSLNVTSVKKNGKDVVTGVYKDKNGKDLAKLEATVNALTEEKIDFDYTFTYGELKLSGKVNVTGNDKSSKFNATVKYDKNTITIKGTNKAVNGEVANYSTSTSDMNDLEIMLYGSNELQGTYIANFIALQQAQQMQAQAPVDGQTDAQ